MKYNLNKFVNAQKKDFDIALKELKNGKKESHYMWYIFPQLKGLGHSYYSDYYGITSLQEAVEYFEDKYLHDNMITLINVLLNLEDNNPNRIFGDPDYIKFKSSMTLFYLATGEKIFKDVLDKFYFGFLDEKTKYLLFKQN